MHTTSMSLTIMSAQRSVKSVERVPTFTLHNVPGFVKSIFSRLSIRHLKKLSFALADSCHKLQIVALEIQASDDTDLIDPDLEKRESLDKTKQFLLKHRSEFRKSFGALDPDGTALPDLNREVSTVISLMGELYEIANELQWAIAEHDASNSERQLGYAASSVDELSAVLDRIVAEA